jgi:hypothetical protein
MSDSSDHLRDTSIKGRDIIKSILITGDHNSFLIGSYESLDNAYIEPWPVFDRVNLDRFLGRKWLGSPDLLLWLLA